MSLFGRAHTKRAHSLVALSVGSAFFLTLGVVGVGRADAGAVASSQVRASGSSASAFPSLGLQNLADTVNGIGQSQFPGSFTGTTLNSDGSITVYVPSSSVSPALAAAISGAASASSASGASITYVTVGASLSALASISAQIRSAVQALEGDGLAMAEWGPDPASGTLKVTLSTPSMTQLQELNTTLGLPAGTVTQSTYAAEALSELQHLYGTLVSVQLAAGSGPTESNRYNDTPRYSAGDNIESNTTICTSGFSVEGRTNPSHFYALTAGHCGASNNWTVGSSGLSSFGETSRRYYNSSAGTDVQTIEYNATAPWDYLAQVWTGANGAPAYRTPVAAIDVYYPAKGTAIYYDGSITKESAADAVDGGGASYCVYYPTVQHTVCNIIVSSLTDVAGSDVTQPGDSGGPVFTYNSANDINGLGLVDGENTGSGHAFATFLCFDINVSNTNLLTDSAVNSGVSTYNCSANV